ncbi:hypothetical protein EYB26_009026 [Talaromyces marneffei]|uniref:uncharacterized protein n=1 Tax=Talaromyces marneffei TaxID=37727 RepID=UPI0012A98147|nr:uncharacterized protein EYB26_009026 [Talaromyces marneffei]QGA21316.1 hypothetical protein EYB26_009026 [Talaromyces marneffei]
MAGSFKTPMVRRRDDGLQLSYSLPHRVFTSKPYPVLTPNGSSIFVYGYDNGLRIVWRGGRSFLSSPIQKNAPNTRRTEAASKPHNNDDSIMIIDSDDEEPAPASSNQDNIEYEFFDDEEVEIEPSRPYEPIIRHVDIPLGTRVLKVAVPSLLPETARSLGYTVPPILTTSIVLSVACADSKLRVISLPLTPPHPSTKASDLKIQTLTLDATVSHTEIPKGVSITFTCETDEKDEDLSRSRSQQVPAATGQWSLLVATHAAEASGTLLVYSIPIGQAANGSYTLPTKNIKPPQKHLLPASAGSISFNPSPYPSARHAHLLVSVPDGYVKILACTTSSKESTDISADEKAGREGKWLLTLYPGFEQSPSALGRRKMIVDAAWVLSGRAIMVLLFGGEWGVWDIEGAGPGSEPGPLVGQSSIHGITGGALTAFSVSGRLLGSPLAINRSQIAVSESQSEQRGKFAPMTPSSRRVREDTLFKGAQPLATPSSDGEISVVQINSSRAAMAEESILIRHGDQIATIPSLLSLWKNSVKATGTFDASNRSRVSPLGGVSLYGERLTGVAHLPSPFRAEIDNGDRQEYEILIAAEHRLIILGRDLSQIATLTAPKRAVGHLPVTLQPSAESDQLKLSQGQLDVDGMSRVLTSMSGALQPALQPTLHSNGFKSPIKRARIFS